MKVSDGGRRRGPEASCGFFLWHANLRWQAAINLRLSELGLTHTQFFLLGALRWLSSNGPAPNQRDLSVLAGVDPMTTSQVLRTLEARRFLARRRDPTDGRAFRVELTPLGDSVSRKAVLLVKQVDADFFEPLADPARFLEQLRDLVESSGGGATTSTLKGG